MLVVCLVSQGVIEANAASLVSRNFEPFVLRPETSEATSLFFRSIRARGSITDIYAVRPSEVV